MELTLKQKTAFGIGAVGKDMVYALSASYVMYYYQDVLGLSASFVGLVLMAARFFDAFNDPFMGVLVAKTRTRWGRFRPWIFSGTLLNALVLYALFAAPVLDEAALMIYFCVVYILWGVTYTMMDIPYWSMIPAVTRTPKDRENLSMVGRTCAGVGSALIAMFTMLLVGALGGDSERAGFRWVALIVAVIFAMTELVCCISMKETTPSEMKTATVKEMFSALFRNDQAMVVVGSIVLINSALYLTSNFIIYFFKYDLGGAGWKATYTLFSTVGGAAQIKAMKKIAGTLKIDQAQFRELESFTKFGGDIDPVTARTIDKGRKNERLLIQPQYHPMAVEEQIAVIFCGTRGLLSAVPMDKVAEFETEFIQMLQAGHKSDVLDVLRSGQLTAEVEGILTETAKAVSAKYAQ